MTSAAPAEAAPSMQRERIVNFLHKIIPAVLTSLTFSLSLPACAAPPAVDTQLDIIAHSKEVWNRDISLTEQMWHLGKEKTAWSDDMSRISYAVTDLDANGRLELLIRGLYFDVSAFLEAKAAGLGEPALQAMTAMTSIPRGIDSYVYEISADGTQLEPVRTDIPPADYTITPDLSYLWGHNVPMVMIDGNRVYHIDTWIRTGRRDGREESMHQYQQVFLKDGILHVSAVAAKYSYADSSSANQPGFVDASAVFYVPYIMHADPYGSEFQAFLADFLPSRGNPTKAAIQWKPYAELDRNPRQALADSWQGFSYGDR